MRLHTAASALALSATLLVAEGALGCDLPSRWLHWSYPDATTEVVPPDAVFRAFAYPQRLVRFELDGVALPSTAEKQRNPLPTPAEDRNRYDNGVPFDERYEDPFGTSEFVPPEPLALGQHEVVIRVSDLRESLPPDMQETYRFQFRVEVLAEATAEPSIARVTSYSWKHDFNGPPVGEAIKAFLRRKWAKELDYRLRKELWAFQGNRIAVRFEYEWHDDGGQWYRSYGNENWEFREDGLMQKRFASINDLAIRKSERRLT